MPDNYLITPFGYAHPSCVIELAQGDTQVDHGHAIQHQDGSITQIAPCAYPSYTAKGEKIAQGQSAQNTLQNQPSISHSWIEDYETTSNTSFGELVASWTVPQAPTSNDGQILFFFPGFEDYTDTVRILQPVLGWNSDFSSAWGIASWNYSPDGNSWESSATRVNPGDTISGSIQSTCSAGTLTCPSWNVVTNDETTGQGTSLLSTASEGQTFNWASAAALEVYNVSQCSDYPANGQITFPYVRLYDNSFNLISTPGWTFENRSAGWPPQCNYGGEQNTGLVTLIYGPPQAPITYTNNTTPSPSQCYEYPFGNESCYLTYSASFSVEPSETLYINGSAINADFYSYSQNEYWGSGQCGYIYDQGYQCWGYAVPKPQINAYATEPGYSDSNIIDISF